MTVFYIIFVLMTVYFSIRYDSTEEYDPKKQHRLWLVCGYLILLSGFSYGLGGDKFTYMAEFETYPDNFSETADYIWLQVMLKGQMPLWTLVNIFCKVVFDSFYAVQLLESAAINIAVCYVVSKYTHRYFLFLLIYFFSLQFFVFNTEVMREGFALAFVLIGMHGWMSGKKWLYFVAVPFGILFHVSAVMSLLFPFVRFKVSWKTLAYAFAASLGLWLFSDLVLGKLMVAVLGGMGAVIEKVLFYSIQASSIFGFLRTVITYLIFPFIIMYSVMLQETDEEKRRRQEKLVAYMVVLGVMVSSFAGFTRVFNQVQIFYLIMLADFVYLLLTYKDFLLIRIATLAGTMFLIFMNYRIYYKTTDTYYVDFFYPYTCILNEDQSVYVREVAHAEATNTEEEDNNVRDIE